MEKIVPALHIGIKEVSGYSQSAGIGTIEVVLTDKKWDRS